VPTSVSQQFKLVPKRLAKAGAFNAILDVDTHFFIDPVLLRKTGVPELKNSHQRVLNHFREILLLLENSKARHDAMWRAAARKLTFHEVKGICMGYSQKGTAGSGMGTALRERLLGTAKEIVDAGIKEPEIFELVGLFEEGIGSDRVSDMIAGIIEPDLVHFSLRVFRDLGVIPATAANEASLPRNPFNKTRVILVPQKILHPLPIAHDWDDISTVVSENERVRREVNQLVGRTWRETRRIDKAELRRALLGNPKALKELLASFREGPPRPYDFAADPEGEIVWHREAEKYTSKYPLSLALTTQPTIDDVEKLVLEICGQFKRLVEDRGLAKTLYREDNGRPRHERHAQLLFLAVADSYCRANNVDISPETNSGRGPVDFKFSRGYELRVLVEVKLSTNPKLVDGYTKQLPQYQKSEQTERAVYMVIEVGGSEQRMKNLRKIAKQAGEDGPKLLEIDGVPGPSASKL
jgi:hypothetical protein